MIDSDEGHVSKHVACCDKPGYSFFDAKRKFAIKSAQSTRDAAAKRCGQPGVKLSEAAAKKCIVEVLPGVFLGSREAENNLALLQERAITHILQVAYEVLPTHSGISPYVYQHVPIYDMEAEDLVSTLECSFAFISGALNTGNKVLCHCLAGNSRSASTILAYMMWHKNVGLSKAMAQLKALRPSVNPNAGFRLQLEWFEDAGCPNPPLEWQGWSLEIFLDWHNSEHRRRQERFKQQQEAHKKRVQEKRAEQQQGWQQDPCSPTQHQQHAHAHVTLPASPSDSRTPSSHNPQPAVTIEPDLRAPCPHSSAPATLMGVSSPKASPRSSQDLQCLRSTPKVSLVPSTSLTFEVPEGAPQTSLPLQHVPNSITPKPPPSSLHHTSFSLQVKSEGAPRPHPAARLHTLSQPSSAPQPHLPLQPAPDGSTPFNQLLEQQRQQSLHMQQQQMHPHQHCLEEHQQQKPYQQPHADLNDPSFSIITDPDFVPCPGHRVLLSPSTSPYSSSPSSSAGPHFHTSSPSPSAGPYPCYSSPSMFSEPSFSCSQLHAVDSSTLQQQQHHSIALASSAQQQYHHQDLELHKQSQQSTLIVPVHTLYPKSYAPATPFSTTSQHGHTPTPTCTAAAASSPCSVLPQHSHAASHHAADVPASAGPHELTTLYGPDQWTRDEHGDGYHTPDAKQKPFQQLGPRGGLRVLLGRKTSLTTPGALASPHLDVTPVKADRPHQSSFPFSSPRGRSSLRPNACSPAARRFLPAPFQQDHQLEHHTNPHGDITEDHSPQPIHPPSRTPSLSTPGQFFHSHNQPPHHQLYPLPLTGPRQSQPAGELSFFERSFLDHDPPSTRHQAVSKPGTFMTQILQVHHPQARHRCLSAPFEVDGLQTGTTAQHSARSSSELHGEVRAQLMDRREGRASCPGATEHAPVSAPVLGGSRQNELDQTFGGSLVVQPTHSDCIPSLGTGTGPVSPEFNPRGSCQDTPGHGKLALLPTSSTSLSPKSRPAVMKFGQPSASQNTPGQDDHVSQPAELASSLLGSSASKTQLSENDQPGNSTIASGQITHHTAHLSHVVLNNPDLNPQVTQPAHLRNSFNHNNQHTPQPAHTFHSSLDHVVPPLQQPTREPYPEHAYQQQVQPQLPATASSPQHITSRPARHLELVSSMEPGMSVILDEAVMDGSESGKQVGEQPHSAVISTEGSLEQVHAGMDMSGSEAGTLGQLCAGLDMSGAHVGTLGQLHAGMGLNGSEAGTVEQLHAAARRGLSGSEVHHAQQQHPTHQHNSPLQPNLHLPHQPHQQNTPSQPSHPQITTPTPTTTSIASQAQTHSTPFSWAALRTLSLSSPLSPASVYDTSNPSPLGLAARSSEGSKKLYAFEATRPSEGSKQQFACEATRPSEGSKPLHASGTMPTALTAAQCPDSCNNQHGSAPAACPAPPSARTLRPSTNTLGGHCSRPGAHNSLCRHSLVSDSSASGHSSSTRSRNLSLADSFLMTIWHSGSGGQGLVDIGEEQPGLHRPTSYSKEAPCSRRVPSLEDQKEHPLARPSVGRGLVISGASPSREASAGSGEGMHEAAGLGFLEDKAASIHHHSDKVVVGSIVGSVYGRFSLNGMEPLLEGTRAHSQGVAGLKNGPSGVQELSGPEGQSL